MSGDIKFLTLPLKRTSILLYVMQFSWNLNYILYNFTRNWKKIHFPDTKIFQLWKMHFFVTCSSTPSVFALEQKLYYGCKALEKHFQTMYSLFPFFLFLAIFFRVEQFTPADRVEQFTPVDATMALRNKWEESVRKQANRSRTQTRMRRVESITTITWSISCGGLRCSLSPATTKGPNCRI